MTFRIATYRRYLRYVTAGCDLSTADAFTSFVPKTTPRSWDTSRAMVYSVFVVLYEYNIMISHNASKIK